MNNRHQTDRQTDQTTVHSIATSDKWTAISRVGSILAGLSTTVALPILGWVASTLVDLREVQASQREKFVSVQDKFVSIEAEQTKIRSDLSQSVSRIDNNLQRITDWVMALQRNNKS